MTVTKAIDPPALDKGGHPMIPMKGSLITLEPLDIEKHAKGYFEMSQDARIHAFTGNTVPNSLEEIVTLLQKYDVYFLNWMILSNETQNVIGIIRLGKPGTENGVKVAGESQFLSPQYWRKGHMKEAKQLFYPYVFEKLQVERLYADVWEGNINSIKSLESYGYKLTETTSGIFPKTGERRKKYIFSLSREDYRLRTGASFPG